MKQDENYGYVLIDTQEKKEKFGPIKKDDQFLYRSDSDWRTAPSGISGVFWPEHTYRRPLVTDSDYELVGLEDTIKDGDEWFNTDTGAWQRWNYSVGSKVRPIGANVAAVRRRKQPTQAVAGWVLTITRLPQDDRLYIVQTVKGDLLTNRGSTIRQCSTQIGQWYDYPNPEMVKSEDEKAFEKFMAVNRHTPEGGYTGGYVNDQMEKAWNASQAHAKGGK